MNKLLIFATILVLSLTTSLVAQVPDVIAYQGRLTDATGMPIADGSYPVYFTIYSSEFAVNALWEESQDIQTIDGFFKVLLGAANPLGDEIFSGSERYLGIKIASDPELTPRERIAATPFALQAFHAYRSSLADSVTGLPSTVFWAESNGVVSSEDGYKVFVGSHSGITDQFGHIHPIFGVYTSGNQTQGAVLIRQDNNPEVYIPALHVENTTSTAIIARSGQGDEIQSVVPTAITGICSEQGGSAAHFINQGSGAAAIIQNLGPTFSDPNPAPALDVYQSHNFYSALFEHGCGIKVASDSVLVARLESSGSSSFADSMLTVRYNGPIANVDHIGISSECKPRDYFGIGGQFIGGYIGAEGITEGEGVGAYKGLRGIGRCTDVNAQAVGMQALATGPGQLYGVYATAIGGASSYAGYFEGDVSVLGTLSKSAGAFRIDHPLDPENKYLQHSFVESPDMKNIYDGNVVTDDNGFATVKLPDWFEALNSDFRYQLTVIGEFAQAIVTEKIKDGQFTIQTEKPHIEVSWQVTGIRKDAFANANRVKVELEKPPAERGRYLYPELLGLDASLKIGILSDEGMRRQKAAIAPSAGSDNQTQSKPATPHVKVAN